MALNMLNISMLSFDQYEYAFGLTEFWAIFSVKILMYNSFRLMNMVCIVHVFLSLPSTTTTNWLMCTCRFLTRRVGQALRQIFVSFLHTNRLSVCCWNCCIRSFEVSSEWENKRWKIIIWSFLRCFVFGV